MVLRLSRALSAGAVASFYVGILAAGCTKADDSGRSACEGETCVVIDKCEADLDCDWGQYCGANKECTSDCVAGGKGCPDGSTCSNLGRCVPNDPIDPPKPPMGIGGNTGIGGFSSIGGSSSGSGGGNGGSCARAEASFEKVIPNIMLVVDRSLSMQEDFDGDESRWNVLRQALIDPTNGFVGQLDAEVRFGLTLYTSPDAAFPGFPGGGGRGGGGRNQGGRANAGSGGVSGAGSGGTTAGATSSGGTGTGGAAGMMCPWLIEVPVALNNLDPISAVYLPNDMKGLTPTGQSLAVVWPKLAAIDETLMPGPKFIILATDGEPNICNDQNAEEQGRQLSVEAITAAYAAGIKTYVISVGEDVGEDHLRAIANIGQGFPATDAMERFYVTTDTTGLVAALKEIILGVRPCDFELEGTVKLDKAEKGVVVIDGTELKYNDPNGWTLTSPTHIQLNGTACNLIREGATEINIDFPCDVFIPKIPE